MPETERNGAEWRLQNPTFSRRFALQNLGGAAKRVYSGGERKTEVGCLGNNARLERAILSISPSHRRLGAIARCVEELKCLREGVFGNPDVYRRHSEHESSNGVTFNEQQRARARCAEPKLHFSFLLYSFVENRAASPR